MFLHQHVLWQGQTCKGPCDGHSMCGRTTKNSLTAQRSAPSSFASASTDSLQQSCSKRVCGSAVARSHIDLSPQLSAQSSRPSKRSGSSAWVSYDEDDPASSTNSNSNASWQSSSSTEVQPNLAPAKTLKINIDLILWRSRQNRIASFTTKDLDERQQLQQAAEAGLRRCLVLDPADARAYVVLGKLLVQQKRYEEARQLYQQGCEGTGNVNPYIWSAWGWLEYLTGNASRARKLYDAATVVDETHACAWHKWGLLEKSEGNYTRARDFWMKGLQKCRQKRQNQNAYLYNALAVMAAQLGRVDEARRWFEEGTKTIEGAASVALWQAWAVLEAKLGDASAVRYLFKRALVANPKSRYVHLAWAMWEKKNGNLMQCLALLQRGCSLNPTDAALHQAWGLVEKERGNISRARELFEAGLKADPCHIPIWHAWGSMEAELDNAERARQLFQEGVWSDPRNRSCAYLFRSWALLEQQQKNYSEARQLFKAAIKVDPKSEPTWNSWIEMEEDLGFLERGQELRIRQAEQQWEFEVPAGFTTRPADTSPLTELMSTLSRFFQVRDRGSRRQPPGSVRDYLPADYQDDVTLAEVMKVLDDPTMTTLPEPVASEEELLPNLQRPPRVGSSRSGLPAPIRRPTRQGLAAASASNSASTSSAVAATRPAAAPPPSTIPPTSTRAGANRAAAATSGDTDVHSRSAVSRSQPASPSGPASSATASPNISRPEHAASQQQHASMQSSSSPPLERPSLASHQSQSFASFDASRQDRLDSLAAPAVHEANVHKQPHRTLFENDTQTGPPTVGNSSIDAASDPVLVSIDQHPCGNQSPT